MQERENLLEVVMDLSREEFEKLPEWKAKSDNWHDLIKNGLVFRFGEWTEGSGYNGFVICKRPENTEGGFSVEKVNYTRPAKRNPEEAQRIARELQEFADKLE